jgi:dihydroneopterin aldolase
MMTIHIEELRLDTIIGILDFERTSKQKVVVETKINYFYTKEKFIDYSIVINMIETLLKEKKYGLVESALDDIGERLLKSFPEIVSLFIKISKPDIIKNASVALSKSWSNGT